VGGAMGFLWSAALGPKRSLILLGEAVEKPASKNGGGAPASEVLYLKRPYVIQNLRKVNRGRGTSPSF